MKELSGVKQVIYAGLGIIFYGTYVTNHRLFLGLSWGWYIRRLLFVPVLWALLARQELWVWVLLSVAVLVNLLYWYAARLGYSRFVAGDEGVPILGDVDGDGKRPLAANEKITIKATGLFSVRDWESFVLLKPAQYWQVPLGDHVVMVEDAPKSFLYQFFDAANLQRVQQGWLIFGRELLPVLAVTFRTKWAPQFVKFEVRFYDQNEAEPEAPLRTIYFSFANEQDKEIVRRNIVQDARRVRDG